MSSCSKKSVILFCVVSIVPSLSAGSIPFGFPHQQPVRPEFHRDLDCVHAYCCVVAGMSGLSLFLGAIRKETIEIIVGLLGVMVSTGILLIEDLPVEYLRRFEEMRL